MKLFRTVLALLLVLSFTLFAAGPIRAASDTPAFASDQILVKFKGGTDEATQGEIHRKYGGAVVAEIRQLGVKVIRVSAGNVPDKVKAYRGEKDVAFAEPDFIAEAIGVPNDPRFSNQWGLSKVQSPQAWDITTGSVSIKIAVLDTRVDQNHEDLATKIVANANFTSSSTVDDRYGHGTHVAGIAAAATNNGIGVAGLGYNSVIMNVKVLDDKGSGYYSWIANGIIWAADNGAKVINMSLGGSSSATTLEDAINYAWGKGVVVVAAAGNSGTSALSYPAAYTNCIAVAATDQNDAKASFSNYGSWVDVAAQGVSIYSTLPNHSNKMGGTNYGSLNGTSMASPFVAGLAGLVWSTSYGTTNGNVRDRIQTTADLTGSMWSSYGIKRINAYNAVASATPLPDTTPPETNISTKPANPTNSTSASFTWTGNDNITPIASLVYSYQLDGGGWSAFAGYTSASYSGLAEGSHNFEVKANDVAGNEDPTPASWSWVIDTIPPTISGVTAVPTATTATITWTTNELADSRVDYGLTASYGSSVSNPTLVASHSISLMGLSPATTYYYNVSSRDAAGNSASSTGYTFTTTSALKISIQSVSVVLVKSGLSYSGQAAVTIVANGSPVQGATVSGQWSGATKDTDIGVTDASGTVVVLSDKMRRPARGTVFTFTVTSVTHPDFAWDGVFQSGSSAPVP